jgi:hypothetical protein
MQMYCTFVLFVNQHFLGLPASETHCIWLVQKGKGPFTSLGLTRIQRDSYWYINRDHILVALIILGVEGVIIWYCAISMHVWCDLWQLLLLPFTFPLSCGLSNTSLLCLKIWSRLDKYFELLYIPVYTFFL